VGVGQGEGCCEGEKKTDKLNRSQDGSIEKSAHDIHACDEHHGGQAECACVFQFIGQPRYDFIQVFHCRYTLYCIPVSRVAGCFFE
jgi:hypothetical protein